MAAIGIDQFMRALSGQESGGSSTAQNARTGAYGTYQIMPGNWPAWSREAGIPGAPQTPENQEKVARFKIQQYYDKFGNWQDVASAWYSGSPTTAYTSQQLSRKQGNGNEPSIAEYVSSVLARAGGSPGGNVTTPSSSGDMRQEFANWAKAEFGLTPPKRGDFPGSEFDKDGAAAFSAAQTDYFKNLASLAPIWNATKSPTAKGVLSDDQKAQQDIKNKMDALDLQVKAGQLDASQAATQLSAFINEQKNALDLGTQQQKAHEQLDLYGPGGDFSYSDMGGVMSDFATRNGLDPSSSAIKYRTAQSFDPAAAYKQNITTMGGGNGAPTTGTQWLDLVNAAMAGNSGATGSIGGAPAAGMEAVGGVGNAAAVYGAANSSILPPGYGATAGLGDATTPQNAITPYTPPWANRLIKPPQLVGGL